MMRIKKLALLATLPLLISCSWLGVESDPTYSNKDQQKLYKNGSLVSDNGGLNVFGGAEKKGEEGNGLGVNGFLWRASLDTISFMPIASADPFGGVIVTDWYSPPRRPASAPS